MDIVVIPILNSITFNGNRLSHMNGLDSLGYNADTLTF